MLNYQDNLVALDELDNGGELLVAIVLNSPYSESIIETEW